MSWDLAAIQSYINNGIEENLYLDYKAADALQKTDGKKKEIAKDISAMANSAGGTIIYGIKEYQEKDKAHLPELIDPVKRSDISKEWLEQVVNANIQPKVNGVVISPVTVDADNVVYVVEIPQSATAHQASDKRYYKRYNFESVAMEDYEIRDIMSRVKHPIVELDFLIECRQVHERDISFSKRPSGQIWLEYFLKVAIQNAGKVYASYVNYHLELPEAILQRADHFEDSPIRSGYKIFYGDNTVRDVVDVTKQPLGAGATYKYGPSRFNPILPRTKSRSETIQLIKKLGDRGYKLFWKIFADNAEARTGEVLLSELLANAEII